MLNLKHQKSIPTERNLDIKSKDWLENSPVCTKVVDPDFNLRYMSRAGIQGLKIENINAYYGKPFPLDFYPEEFRQTMYGKLQESRDTGEVRVHEGKLFTADHQEMWFESTISPILDDQGVLDYFMVASVEINARKKAAEKEILLKEIHHRIKNNLQVVSSLLSLQVNDNDDPEFSRIIQNSKQRISAISLVHEKMYESEISGEVSVKSYIEGLVSNISSTYLAENDKYDEDIQIDDFKLKMDILVPCGLILNEILTNIFKHGFKLNLNPILKIHVFNKKNEVTMVITDNGPGLNGKHENIKSLGMKLIKILAKQINAELQIDSSPNMGVCYTLEFKI